MQNRFVGLFAIAVAIALVSAACSVRSVQDEPGVLPGLATASAQESQSEPGDVPVVEVSLTDFGIEMSQSEFEVGVEYMFEVTNVGTLPHEMMLIHPMESNHSPSMEEVDEMAVMVFMASDLPPGATVARPVTFESPGEAGLEAACYLPGHYQAGMVLPITVVG